MTTKFEWLVIKALSLLLRAALVYAPGLQAEVRDWQNKAQKDFEI